MNIRWAFIPRLVAALALPAASPLARAQGGATSAASSPYGQPLPGLSAAEEAAFVAGLAAFTQVETPETGLGPIYNGTSCAGCHSTPAPGGGSTISTTRFGLSTPGVYDPLTELDGNLLHSRAIAPALVETIPPEANVTAQRLTTPLYGGGLIEAIPDETIVRNSLRRKFPGVAGKVAWVIDAATGQVRVGRFGWKAEHATLLSFSADAFNNEMGITNRVFPSPHAPDGNVALLAQYVSLSAGPEDVVDPATGEGDIDRVADFARYLAPPPPAPATAQSLAGQQIFAAIGCASCHTPEMNTGPNPSPALSYKTVALYSDLLLHDMGSLGDGIAQASASPTQMRTAPLWGLRCRSLYLHDGRAKTLDAAIRDHDGEAAVPAADYARLSSDQQQALLAFLNTL